MNSVIFFLIACFVRALFHLISFCVLLVLRCCDFHFLLTCLFGEKKEEERNHEVRYKRDRENLRGVGEGKHAQNILYGKKFNKK